LEANSICATGSQLCGEHFKDEADQLGEINWSEQAASLCSDEMLRSSNLCKNDKIHYDYQKLLSRTISGFADKRGRVAATEGIGKFINCHGLGVCSLPSAAISTEVGKNAMKASTVAVSQVTKQSLNTVATTARQPLAARGSWVSGPSSGYTYIDIHCPLYTHV
jgi:hypothetical protein